VTPRLGVQLLPSSVDKRAGVARDQWVLCAMAPNAHDRFTDATFARRQLAAIGKIGRGDTWYWLERPQQ
jgi:hypothetical protein